LADEGDGRSVIATRSRYDVSVGDLDVIVVLVMTYLVSMGVVVVSPTLRAACRNVLLSKSRFKE
jgi:uncharacterized membrane protein YjgN (DUF898 family)